MALLCASAARALAEPCETTLRRLLDEYELDTGVGLLTSLAQLQANLEAFSIECRPRLGAGGLDDTRVLSSVPVDSVETVLRIVSAGERANVEFKSSLLLDVRRYRAEPGGQLASYRLDGLTHVAMKTIAAFCNSGGGTVFIGIEDDSSVFGMEEDFLLANPKRGDFDGWDQFLRGQIEARFHDGKAVANYVRAVPFESAGKTFVRLQVSNRSGLTFLKRQAGGVDLFVRSGTRSIPIQFHDIEKHYSLTRMF